MWKPACPHSQQYIVGRSMLSPEVNNNDKAEELTYEILKMFEDEFQDAHHVDAALDRIPDLSLEAEVCRWRGLKKHV
jgi:hypothetical protein